MMLEALDLGTLFLLFILGVFAGIIESTAGGSGLITLPVLLLLGIPPVQAIATSKFQFAFGAVTAIFRFSRAGVVSWKELAPSMMTALLSGAAGAYLLSQADANFVRKIIPFLLIAVAIYFAKSPTFDDEDRPSKISFAAFSFLVVPIIGFYDGFLGTGSASFMTAAFVMLLGFNVTRSVASTKFIDFMSGAAALAVLAFGGHVLIVPGVALGLGQILGTNVGVSLVLAHGARWVRPVIVVTTIALSVQILIKALST